MRNILIGFLVLFSSYSFASITIDDVNTDVVNLRDNCSGVSNCATTVHELLNWVWGTRVPSVTNPLLVDIGPGIFVVKKVNNNNLEFCHGGGNVTFKGSGVGRTILTGKGSTMPDLVPFVSTNAVVKIDDCDNLTFQDLSIQTRAEPVTIGGGVIGVGWSGGGKSVWNNVHIKSDYWSWVDVCSSSGTVGEHKWFSSSLQSGHSGAVSAAYRSDCATNIIHGSELFASRDPGDSALLSTFIVVEAISANASIQLYGSSVRALYPNNASGLPYATEQIIGLNAKDGGIIHMHGGIISVRSEHPSKSFDVVGAQASNGSMIHVLDTSYGMKAGGSGTIKRLVTNNGTISSPFQWATSDTPPVIQSIDGYDTFIETDCDSAGNCDSPSGTTHPHMMTYDASCVATTPWYDMATNKCRGE